MVQRYFAKVLTPNQPLVHHVYLEQTGTFNRSFQQPQWDTFLLHASALPPHAQASSGTRPSAWGRASTCVWSTPMWPEQAPLQPSVLGLVDLAGQQGGADIARGELMRYLAEAVWYPTALLPGQGVQWTAVDAQSALATLTDGALTVALTFHFDAQGWVQRITSDARSAMVDGTLVPMPWEAVVSDYQLRDGMWVPCRPRWPGHRQKRPSALLARQDRKNRLRTPALAPTPVYVSVGVILVRAARAAPALTVRERCARLDGLGLGEKRLPKKPLWKAITSNRI